MIYFRPFLRLFEERNQKTIKDREEAEKLALDAQKKFEIYQHKIDEARAEARTEYENILSEAKAKESEMIMKTRSEVKAITQKAMEEMETKRQQLRQELEGEVGLMAKSVRDKLLSDRV